MCSIVGAALSAKKASHFESATSTLEHIMRAAYERGRDGRGYVLLGGFDRKAYRSVERSEGGNDFDLVDILGKDFRSGSIVGNFRAEPTTEFVLDKQKEDQQPYCIRGWNVVHNGTVANDASLRTLEISTMIDSAAIAEIMPAVPTLLGFADAMLRVKGSYAVLATHDSNPEIVYAAANYRPVWYSCRPEGVYFASARHHFPKHHVPEMLEPYTAAIFSPEGRHRTVTMRKGGPAGKALVVCSGGLDSTVAAAIAQADGYEIELAHFQYGSRAEGPEVRAVQDVGDALNAPVHFIPIGIYDPSDSPLLRSDSAIAGGEEGAEFAYEWVPARNLVMLAVATAFAEAKGFDTLVLGNNLEEAGAYPDNEPEFIARFNDLLPFAVGDGKRLRVTMPVGNMMKHEIVKVGHRLGAPIDKTWSCYRAGEKHCGTCGPCFMRRTAFNINRLEEVIEYEKES